MDKSHNNLQAEVDALKKRLNELEIRGPSTRRSTPRRRSRWIIFAGLPVLLLTAAGALHSEAINALFIDKEGKVGIGHFDPKSTLDVRGTLKVSEKADVASLNVTGKADVASLNVTGKAEVASLNVKGKAEVASLEVTGKLEMPQNQVIQIGRAYLSSGGDYVHLANNEYYNGTWVGNGSRGALIQLDGQAINFFRHDGLGKHVRSMSIDSSGNVVVNDGSIKGRIEARYDSGWKADSNTKTHQKIFQHDLKYLPINVTVYFSPNADDNNAYLVSYSRGESNRNPISVQVNKTQVVLNITKARGLHNEWKAIKANGNKWKANTHGFWKVIAM